MNSLKSPKKDRQYQIWRTGHAPKEIETENILRQKLEYIHYNPCSNKWKLCKVPEEYPYSSAGDYYLGKKGLLEIKKIDLL